MAYHVIKTINGKAYRYAQTSIRQGGKVKTLSRYLGPVVDDHTPAPTAASEVKDSTPVNDVAPEPAPPSATDNDLTLQKTHDLNIRCDLAKHRISQDRLTCEYRAHLSRLQRAGLDTRQLPPLTIRYGKQVGYHKAAFKNELVVTLPKRGKGHRQQLRQAYRQALARLELDAIEAQQPARFNQIQAKFNTTFIQAQRTLRSYLWHTEDKDKVFKVIGLTLFAYMNPPKGKLPPEKLGLIDYGKRQDWRSDWIDAYAEVQDKGFNTVLQATAQHLKTAQRAERQAIRDKTLLSFYRRRRAKKAIARRQLVQLKMDKLIALRFLLDA